MLARGGHVQKSRVAVPFPRRAASVVMRKGNNHAHRDLPFLLAGRCGGHFRTGRFVDFMAGGASGRPHNDLLVSLANAMGLPDAVFGDPTYCTGALPGLT